jgi:aryl-alcohol dehydrogenase-like predicted oxidoreductase
MQENPKAGPEVSRRGFLKGAAIAGVSSVIPTDKIPTAVETKDEPALGNFQAPKRPLGKTGLECSILGMGGFHLATVGDQTEINNMVAKAADHGINIFDNAWEYLNGLGEERLGVALRGRRESVIVVSSVCTHGRKQDVAMRMLEQSLVRLQTDHLDIWQIHEVIYHNDPELIYAPSKGAFTPSQALSYAMSLPVATTISGMDSMEVLDQNLAILRGFKPLSADAMQLLRDQGKQFDDGRYELYKSTIKYDRDLGRSQHGYPSSAELPV